MLVEVMDKHLFGWPLLGKGHDKVRRQAAKEILLWVVEVTGEELAVVRWGGGG